MSVAVYSISQDSQATTRRDLLLLKLLSGEIRVKDAEKAVETTV